MSEEWLSYIRENLTVYCHCSLLLMTSPAYLVLGASPWMIWGTYESDTNDHMVLPYRKPKILGIHIITQQSQENMLLMKPSSCVANQLFLAQLNYMYWRTYVWLPAENFSVELAAPSWSKAIVSRPQIIWSSGGVWTFTSPMPLKFDMNAGKRKSRLLFCCS